MSTATEWAALAKANGGYAAMSEKPLTPAMLRELRHIEKHGEPCDLAEFNDARHLAFHAREKVLSALIRRGLLDDAETVSDAGRAALAKANGGDA